MDPSKAKNIYDTNYIITSKGEVYSKSKLGRLKQIPASLNVSSDGNEYIYVYLRVKSTQNEDKISSKKIPVKKIMADHFKIKSIKSRFEYNGTYDYSYDVTGDCYDCIRHIDGNVYDCSVENLYFDPSLAKEYKKAERVSRKGLYRLQYYDDAFTNYPEKVDLGKVDPLLEGYSLKHNGDFISHKKKETIMTPKLHHKCDRHLSVMVSTIDGKRKWYVLCQLMLRAFKPKVAEELLNTEHEIFYSDGNRENCNIVNIVVGVKLSDATIREHRKNMQDMNEDKKQDYMNGNLLLEIED